tara:strand:- start:5773 stop:5985 length:213 start_codon:yes stop_codon:yes gene_type:complete
MNVDIDPPAKTPTKLAKISADADPRKTASGFFDEPLKVNVANCVLSPNSARKTVMNEEIRRFINNTNNKY